jgi:hypothetical protein
MIIVQIRKNSHERVRISLDSFKGRSVCNIRVFFQSAPETWLPTPKGIAFMDILLPELIMALESAEEQRKEKKSWKEGIR